MCVRAGVGCQLLIELMNARIVPDIPPRNHAVM
jgi:hypothetical protein